MSFHFGPISHIYSDFYYESLIGEGLKGLKCNMRLTCNGKQVPEGSSGGGKGF
jgi:hypothetical protein